MQDAEKQENEPDRRLESESKKQQDAEKMQNVEKGARWKKQKQ
jgi:hypothetical protein